MPGFGRIWPDISVIGMVMERWAAHLNALRLVWVSPSLTLSRRAMPEAEVWPERCGLFYFHFVLLCFTLFHFVSGLFGFVFDPDQPTSARSAPFPAESGRPRFNVVTLQRFNAFNAPFCSMSKNNQLSNYQLTPTIIPYPPPPVMLPCNTIYGHFLWLR